jgi:hypothetical protein
MLATGAEAGIGGALQRVAAMPAFLQAAIDAAPPGALTARGSNGTFALVEQACHLRDLEREGYLVRVRRILAEEAPALEPFLGDVVARERDYLAQDAQRAARDFARARAELVALLAKATPRELARIATFEGERITLAGLVGMIEEHDAGHRAEIEHLRATVAR